MNDFRLLEMTYGSLTEHEPLRQAIIRERRQAGKRAQNTVLLYRLERPSVQLGEFQDIDEELHVEECQRFGVDISRRIAGGGCLFYDEKVRFVVGLLDPDHFPNLEEAARIWQGEMITGLLHTLGAQDAWYRHIGDVNIGQTKVSGLGVGVVEGTLNLGSFINMGTPQVELAIRLLRIPPEKFADKAVSGLQEYVSSVEKASGHFPSWEEFREAVKQNARKSLGVNLVSAELTPREKEIIDQLRPFYSSREWIYKRFSRERFSGLPAEYTKGKSRRKARKLVIAHVALDGQGRIGRAMLCGDFFIQPAMALEEIEKSLEGVDGRNEEKILGAIKGTLERLKGETPMLEPEDFALPLIQAAREALKGGIQSP
jgi:lipoate-protein ligase A